MSAGLDSWRPADTTIVFMWFTDQSTEQKHLQQVIVGLPGNMDARRPASERLVGGNRARQHIDINISE